MGKGTLRILYRPLFGGSTIGVSIVSVYCRDRLLYYASQAGDNILRHLHTSFSQLNNDDDSVETQKYVQDNIRKYKLELSKWIMEDNAIVYICGYVN